MKTKLLKKIRKRYEWRINQHGNPVLIDKWKQDVTVIDDEYLKTSWFRNPYEPSENEEVRVLVRWRVLKAIMFRHVDKNYVLWLNRNAFRVQMKYLKFSRNAYSPNTEEDV